MKTLWLYVLGLVVAVLCSTSCASSSPFPDRGPDGGLTIAPEPAPEEVTHFAAARPDPSGTGFAHVTSGAYDIASRAVNLATADVTGVLGTSNGGFAAGGDLSGSTSSQTVIRLQTIPVLSGTPTGSQLLQYSSTNAQWQAETPTGDVSSTEFGSFTVAKIQHFAVSSSTPSSGAVLDFEGGSTWTPRVLSQDATMASGGAVTVTGLQTRAMSNSAPTNGQAIVWNSGGSTWQPGTVSAGGSASGSLGGTYPGPTVVQVDGSGTNDYTSSGTLVNVVATETILASSTSGPVRGSQQLSQTTDGTTWVNCGINFTLSTNTTLDGNCSFLGRDNANTGNFYRGDLVFSVDREGSGATLYPSAPSATNARSNGGGSTYTVQAIVSSATVTTQVKGNASTTVNWTCICQGQHR